MRSGDNVEKSVEQGTALASGQNQVHRSYLMLQGLASPFFAELAKMLTADGSPLHKINYCGGDWWFSPSKSLQISKSRFNGRQKDLPAFYRDAIAQHDITDIILFGDCRPIHKAAIEVAEVLDIPAWVFEEGYTRPGYVTCEQGGTNGRSPLPRSAEQIKRRAKDIEVAQNADAATDTGALPPKLPNPMPARVRMDFAHHFWNICLRPFYFRFQTHRPHTVKQELSGWARRLKRKRRFHTENAALVKLFETADKPFFMVPLQLNSDYQIRDYSPYAGVLEFIREVISSFAKNANTGTHLMFKAHPLDNGMIDYRSYIAMAAIKHGLEGQIHYLEGGDLDRFLKRAEGLVLINSTVGYAALKKAKSMKVMGTALYNVKGLTEQRALDKFWKKPAAPDISLISDFLTVVRNDSQVPGDFFTGEGIKMAANAAAIRIKAGTQFNSPSAATSDKARAAEEVSA
jgi:capsular polysaccharide export protein